MSYNYIVTTKGLDMIAQIQADPTKKIEFIRAQIGNGEIQPEDIIEEFDLLKGSIIHDSEIQKKEFLSDESVKITINYSNENVTSGFYVTEVGLYAKDPLDETKEVLFLYCNSSEADFLPDNSSVVNVEQVVNLIIKMSNAENVTVTASSSSNVIRENFGDHTILKSDTEGEPTALRVEPGRVVGRKGSDSDVIEDLTPSETREILNVPELVDGKISSQHNNVTSSPRQAILALNDISFKTSNVKIADEHSYTGNGVVRELDFGMDFVTQDSVNQFGGIAFGKIINENSNIRYKDTDMLDNQYFFLTGTNPIQSSDSQVRKFTEKGVEIGIGNEVNKNNSDCEFFAFQTTKNEKKKVYEGVKSVVFRCHNNWGNIHIGFRLIEFYNGEIPYQLAPSDYTTFASSIHSGTGYHSDNAFNTSQSLTGSHSNTEWLTDCYINNEQTLVVVFNTPIDITNLVINNSHNAGDSEGNGAKDIEVFFTDQTLDASHAVWDSSIPNGEEVWSGRLSRHIELDIENPQTIMYTPWRYNPNNGFAFQTRTGSGVAEQIKNPPEMDGMKLCFRFSKNSGGNYSWNTFTDKLESTQGLFLNLSSNPTTSDEFANNEDPDSDHFSIGSHNNINQRGNTIKDYCFFGKDLSYIEPGLTGIEGATAFFKADPSQTFDCGFEPQMIIVKSLETANNWYLHTKNKNFETVMMLSDPNIPAKTTLIVNGSKITAPSAATGKYLIIAFAEVVSVPADNKAINTLVKSSPGTLAEREVDMGMDFISDENGGMVLTKGGSNNWALFDTVRGPLKRLQTDNTSAEDSNEEYVKEFTKNGVRVGSHTDVNGESDQFYMGFQTDEKVKPPKWKAKSVIFDIADNHGASDYIRLRSVEFYKDGGLIPLTESDFASFSTSNNSGYEAKNLFIIDLPKTGTDANTGWRSETNVITNQRVVVVFNNEIEFDKVVINNGHDSGGNTTSGAKLIDIQITNHEYKSSGSYGDIVVGITNRIFRSNIIEHSEKDEADDKIYVDISDEWQINRASGFGLCKITGTGANRVFRTPFGKEPCMMWIKNVGEEGSWPVYFHAVGESDYLFLDTTGAATSTEYFEAYPDIKKPFSKDEFYLGSPALNQEYIIYAWFGDYFQGSGTGDVVSEDNKRVMGVKGTTAFFKGTKSTAGTDVYETHIDEIETIIWKSRTDSAHHWHLINKGLNNFQELYYLDSNEPKTNASVSINGSKITIISGSSILDTFIFMVFGRTADKDTKDYIPWMNQVKHIGTGETDTIIDLGLDFTGENGGMILNKSLDDSFNWFISDTLRGAGKFLLTDANNAEASASESIKEFTSNGIKVGSQSNLNNLNSEIATFGFHTTHKTKPTTRKVKSAVFKFADNWTHSQNMGVRRIEFFKDNLINLGPDDFTAYSTTALTKRDAKYAFITSGSKIGESDYKSWTSNTNETTNQVLIIVFKNPQDIDFIRVNNLHETGAQTIAGVKNTKVYFTEDEYTETSYFSEVSNSELVFDGVFDQHHASDYECYTQYLYTPWHYNPQTGFGFFTHKGNGTEITFPNILGKQPTMIWSKSISYNHNWITYCSNVGEGKSGVLSGTNALTGANAQTFKEVNKDNIKYGSIDNLNYLNHNYISYVWFGDDMSTLGNPQDAYGILGTSLFTEKKAANTEIELGFVPDIIIHKSISTAGNWGIFSLNYSINNENIFDRALLLDTGGSVVNVAENSKIWVEGTKLKFGSAFSSDYLICAFAKNTYKPQGKSIVIHGSESNPSLFSIANGFNEYQAVEKLIGYKRNVVFNFNEGDGTYYIKLNIDGTITLKNQNCFYGRSNPSTGQDFFDVEKYRMFSPSGSVVPGIYIGKIVIQNDAILDVEKFQTGINAIVDWFPVGVNSMYIKDNPFFTTEIDWDIWWNSIDSDENMRHVTGQYYWNSISNGMGAYKEQNSENLIIGSGSAYTFYSSWSGNPYNSTGGYYKLVIRRGF